MKTSLFWILCVVLIWYSNAQSRERNSAIKNALFRIMVEKEKSREKLSPLNSTRTETGSNASIRTTAIAPKNRRKRYTHKLPWRKDELTYSILKYTRDLPPRVQERVLGKAFNVWHKAAPQLKFTFKRKDTKADIKIRFVKGPHGDVQAFDGRGSLIAHVFSPEDGRMHFDDDEWFTDKSRYGTNLLFAAIHEVGHALGLGHSTNKSSVMYKLYRKYTGKDVDLDEDDVKNIRMLYRINPRNRRNPNCKERDRRICMMFKKQGYCTPANKSVMRQYCQFTCGHCDT